MEVQGFNAFGGIYQNVVYTIGDDNFPDLASAENKAKDLLLLREMLEVVIYKNNKPLELWFVDKKGTVRFRKFRKE